MITVLMTYKLKKGVTLEEFKEYSLSKDQPMLNSFEAVKDFSVYIVEGENNEIDVFEIIKVESKEEFDKLSKSQKVKENGKIWATYCNKESGKKFIGEKLTY